MESSIVGPPDTRPSYAAGWTAAFFLVGGPNLPKGERTRARHFNTTVLRAPTKAYFGIGNAPKDPIRGPGTNNWDISVFKNFRLFREGRVGLQYRLEMHNAFNHTQFTGVDTYDTALRRSVRESEFDSKLELYYARQVDLSAGLAKARAGDVRVNSSEANIIEKVERIRPECQP